MKRSIGLIVLNFSVAIYLLATGILGVSKEKSLFGVTDGEIRKAVTAVFGRGDLTDILVIVIGVLAIAAGGFILLKFFGIDIPINELALVILAIVWVVFIIMIDIVTPIDSNSKFNLVDWMKTFGGHAMALGGILLATERFGG